MQFEMPLIYWEVSHPWFQSGKGTVLEVPVNLLDPFYAPPGTFSST